MIPPQERKKNKLFFSSIFHLQLKIYSHFINGITVKLLRRSTRLINSKSAGRRSPSGPDGPVSPSAAPKKVAGFSRSLRFPAGWSILQHKTSSRNSARSYEGRKKVKVESERLESVSSKQSREAMETFCCSQVKRFRSCDANQTRPACWPQSCSSSHDLRC